MIKVVKSNLPASTSIRLTAMNAPLSDGVTKYNYSHLDKTADKQYNCNNDNNPKVNPGCITAICDAVYTDDATARDFLCFLDDAIENISARSALIGAYMNRVESAVDAIGVQKENIVSANSSIISLPVASTTSSAFAVSSFP